MAVTPDPALDAPAPPPPPTTDADGYPRWPLWLPLAALATGVSFAFVAIAVLAGVLDATGAAPGGKGPGISDASTVILDFAVVGASVAFAAATLRPRASHFGLRGGPLGRTVAIAAGGMLAFFLFSLVYTKLVHSKGQQKIVDALGADKNTVLLIAGALLVIVVAPICEELFFRGVLFRVLRMRLPLWLAAAGDGVAFGIVHYEKGALAVLPILAFLGFVLCYVLEYTGTLFATIAIHALNNTISYGYTTDNGWVVSLAVGAAMLAFCAIGLRRAPRGVPHGGANPSARLDLPSPG